MLHHFNCPYCNEPFTVCHDDGHGCNESELHQDRCPACDKYFTFSTSIVISHEAYQADCLNDGNHDYQLSKYTPKRYARMRCAICDEERNPTAEERLIYKLDEDE